MRPAWAGCCLRAGACTVFLLQLVLLCRGEAPDGATAPADDDGSTGTCSAKGGCPVPLEVPRVIIGCWQLLERHADHRKAVETLTAYAEAGFTVFDTADIYGPSEQILGQFRKQWVKKNPSAPQLRFFTKYVTDNLGRKEAERINQQSCRHLGVDTLDMVQFHFWSLAPDGSSKNFLKAGRELSQLKEEGKILHLAGCNMDTTNLKMLVDNGMPVQANQVQYSLLDRRPEVRLLKYCKQAGIKLLIFGVVGGGLLSDSFLGVSEQNARGMLNSVSRRMYFSSLQRWSPNWSLFQELLTTLQAIGQRKQPAIPIAAVASAWALHRLDLLGAGGALILGVRDAGHLQEHSALLHGHVTLEDRDMQELQVILDKGSPPQGDIWYEERGWS